MHLRDLVEERIPTSVCVEITEMQRAGVARGGGGDSQLGHGSARHGIEVECLVDAVDQLVDGHVLPVSGEVAVVGERV